MEEYKYLLNSVSEFLKKEGFRKKGSTFYIIREENYGLINFQKSIESSKAIVKFTINIGVKSTILSKVLTDNNEHKSVSIGDCHWNKRIGFLLPQKDDFWWALGDNNSPIEKITSDILTLLKELIIPELDEHISNESLKAEWLTGISPGITEFQRYTYLTTFLMLNKDERLNDIVKSFISFSKSKSREYMAKEHLKEIGLYEY